MVRWRLKACCWSWRRFETWNHLYLCRLRPCCRLGLLGLLRKLAGPGLVEHRVESVGSTGLVLSHCLDCKRSVGLHPGCVGLV